MRDTGIVTGTLKPGRDGRAAVVEWVWPVAGLVVVSALLWLGVRVTRYKHEAMVLLCIGEVHRLRGDEATARRFYDASKTRGLRLPEADEALYHLERGSRDPVIDHPMVADIERRLRDEPEKLGAWLAARGLPRP